MFVYLGAILCNCIYCFTVSYVQWFSEDQILNKTPFIFQAIYKLQDLQLSAMSCERKRKNHADPGGSDNIEIGKPNTAGCVPVQQCKRQRFQEFTEEQSVIDLFPLEQLRNQLLQQQLPVLSPMFQWEVQPQVPGQGQKQAPRVQLVTQQVYQNPNWNQWSVSQTPMQPPVQLQAIIQPPQEREKSLTPSPQMKNTEQQTEAFPRKDGLAIACHVPEKIKQAIRESKYVDLEKLLLCNELDEEGEVILYRLVQKKRATEAIKIKHKIDGITAWVKAFTVYMVIYLEAHPENAAYLASYISAIVWWNSTLEWNAVYNYDKDLRRKREKIPETSWTAVDFELMKEMQLHERDYSPPPYDPKKECRQYNGGFCSRSAAACRWAHKCLNCGKKGHPVVKCWHLKSTPK